MQIRFKYNIFRKDQNGYWIKFVVLFDFFLCFYPVYHYDKKLYNTNNGKRFQLYWNDDNLYSVFQSRHLHNFKNT